jgi:hypothetical protein
VATSVVVSSAVRSWLPALRAAGFEHRCIYDLRHSLAAGMSLFALSRRMVWVAVFLVERLPWGRSLERKENLTPANLNKPHLTAFHSSSSRATARSALPASHRSILNGSAPTSGP